MKLYALKVDRGSWDDWSSFIVGIFDNKEKAEEELNKWKMTVKSQQQKYSGEERDDFEDELDLNLGKKGELPTHLQEYLNWRAVWCGWNTEQFSIEEFQLNQTKEFL